MRNFFKDNVVIITGASSGIGKEIALQLAMQGARLSLALRNEERLRKVSKKIRSLGAEVMYLTTDVSKKEDCKWLVEKPWKDLADLRLL